MSPAERPRRPSTSGAAARSRRRRWVAAAVGAAAVIAVGVLVVAPARGSEAATVAQFTHIHGLEVPAWAHGDVFVSTHFGLLRIGEGGAWLEVGDAKHDFMGFKAHPSDPGVLYSSGHPAVGSGLPNPIGFMISRDSGRTWRPLALAGRADFHALAVQPSNGDVVYGFNSAVDPGIYRSLDGGQTWSVIESPSLMRVGGPFALAVHPGDRDVLLAGTRAGLLVSRDAGSTWDAAAFDGVAVTAVAFGGPTSTSVMAYAAAPDAGLVRSDDGGATWSTMAFVLDDNDAVGYIAFDPSDADRIYLGSFGMDLYRTVDGGGDWQALAVHGVPQ